jgi:NADPH2:quinone reductase
MRVEALGDPQPGRGQARVRVHAAGVNFIDTYHRSGAYPVSLPTGLGVEAAGVVDAVGTGVTDVAVGDRVAYVMDIGSYADHATVAADRLVPVPDGVGLELAAAVLLQGLTAHFLSRTTYPLGPRDTALVLAAAGGVGHLLVQMAASRGARVIAVTSTEEKAQLVRGDGAHEVLVNRIGTLAADVRDLTAGRGVDVVYDGVGRATFDAGMDCLRPRGMMVLYGAASGPVAPVDPQTLSSKGSLFLTRPSLPHHIADREELTRRAREVFDLLDPGTEATLRVRVDRTFALEDAAAAHRYLEAGRTHGKVLLIP